MFDFFLNDLGFGGHFETNKFWKKLLSGESNGYFS